jgi:hypothetical protein
MNEKGVQQADREEHPQQSAAGDRKGVGPEVSLVSISPKSRIDGCHEKQ